jgi:periplasmic copper chaperone A
LRGPFHGFRRGGDAATTRSIFQDNRLLTYPNFRAGWALIPACACLLAAPLAHAYDVGPLHIGHPWTRPTPDGAPTAAGYLTVTNHGRAPDRLLGGASPLARSVEPHTSSMSGGVMRMRMLSDGYEIPPGATLTLAPMGNHLMFVGLERPFKVGERVPATLRFAHAGAVNVEFVVQAAAPTSTMTRQMDMK